jgi:hypothetical protein
MKMSMSLVVSPSPRAAEPKIDTWTGTTSQAAISTRNRRSSSARTSASSSLDRAAQLARDHARVALRRVEVLVTEQLLDLAQVRTCLVEPNLRLR